jgi:hypothetical protein
MDKLFPGLKVPSFNLDAYIALQKANVDTLVQAQSVFVQAAQSIAKLRAALIEESFKKAETAFKFDPKVKPEAYFAEAKANAEKFMAAAKQELDLGVKAQNDVAQLVVKRAVANVEELKALATAA